jgi:hypothetical protein
MFASTSTAQPTMADLQREADATNAANEAPVWSTAKKVAHTVTYLACALGATVLVVRSAGVVSDFVFGKHD